MAVSAHTSVGRADLGSFAAPPTKYVLLHLHRSGVGRCSLGRWGLYMTGTLLMFSANTHLLKFLTCRHDGEDQPQVQAIRQFVEGHGIHPFQKCGGAPLPLHAGTNPRPRAWPKSGRRRSLNPLTRWLMVR